MITAMVKRFTILLLLFGDICLSLHAQQSGKPRRPNIILILADDLGYGNLTCYMPGGKIRTPNIDKLAQNGLRFTSFHSGSTVCAPSRCALMTGRDMGHAYIRGNVDQANLRPQDTTLAQRLHDAGYTTGMFGKWGLGERFSSGEPQKKGFDAFFGYLNQVHAHAYFTDSLFEIQRGDMVKVDLPSKPYAPDLILGKAMRFMTENRDRPFFLYFSTTIPHAETLVPDSLMKPFLKADGSSVFGDEKPYPGAPGSLYGAQPKPHAAFAAMVTKLDSDVGRIVQQVKALGLENDTYIIFTSDNGAHNEGGGDAAFFNSSGPLRGIKRDLYEGGINVPFIVRCPANKQKKGIVDGSFAFWDIQPTLCALAGAKGTSITEGISFLGSLEPGKTSQGHKQLYWQFCEGVLKEALIRDDWKLVRFKSKGKPEVLELYNLGHDHGEKLDVAARYPERVATMKAIMLTCKTPAEHPDCDYSEYEQ